MLLGFSFVDFFPHEIPQNNNFFGQNSNVENNYYLLGKVAQDCEPFMMQVFIKGADSGSMDR